MPLPVISICQMRDWEKATWASGQTEAEVIRRVGLALARTALRLTRPGDLVLILAGKGNNGEDARCCKAHLPDRRVDLVDVSDPRTDLARLNALLSLRPALIIDGLFGIGLNRSLSQDWVRFIEAINECALNVLAVDVPSGLNADTGEPEGAAVRAALTLTVGAPKSGMMRAAAWPFVGRLEVASEVGLIPCPFSEELNWVCDSDFRHFPPGRPAASHKGTYGHLAIVAGSMGYHGASVLAAKGAQRARPGLITLYTMPAVYAIAGSHLEAVMVHPFEPTTPLPSRFDALLFGPGLAAPDAAGLLRPVLEDLWRTAAVPLVVDASALVWIPPGPILSTAPRVITPHPGEAGRLLGEDAHAVQSDRPAALSRLSKKFGDCWVVLKGHQTLIGRNEGPILANSSGSPSLAQGGSGDVLSGYLSGLLSQPQLRADLLKSLAFGVWQHGGTADQLDHSRPNWVVEELAAALGSPR